MPSPSITDLLKALEKIDLKIRTQVARFREAQQEDEQFRGLYVSEEQVDALLASPLGMPTWMQGQHAPEDQKPIKIEEAKNSRLTALAKRFDLKDLDLNILLTCLAVELDTRYEKLYAYLQDDVTRTRPSIDLVLTLLVADPTERLAAREHFAEDAPLRRARLIEVFEDASRPSPPFIGKLLRVDERVTSYLLDSDRPDARIAPFVYHGTTRDTLDDLVLDGATRQGLKTLTHEDEKTVIHIQGPTGAGKRTVARAMCHERGVALLEANIERLIADADTNVTTSFALIAREARLCNAALYLNEFDALLAPERHAMLHACLDAAQTVSLTFLAGETAWLPGSALRGARFFAMSLARPETPERLKLWRKAAGAHGISNEEAALDLPGIATKFRFTPGQIEDSWRSAASLATWRAKAKQDKQDEQDKQHAKINAQDLYDACRLNSNRTLATLAQKISPRFSWGDIVLPADRIAQLREICNHIKYRNRVFNEWGFDKKLASSKGLTFLFAGPSGTGKTMAAGIIANELGLDLYKIDLSLVISKFIGETEKNLARIFDEAETANAILFFDEADSLFGKRSDVKDSHDRYANIEVGYLLQRIEEYEGIAILATNFRRNMDEAFVRRLQFTVDFPLPSESDRHRMWMAILPADTPRDPALDLGLMARRYNLTGGNIRNIALAAAFLAADDGDIVRMRHLISATQREYQKMGKLVNEGDFAHGSA